MNRNFSGLSDKYKTFDSDNSMYLPQGYLIIDEDEIDLIKKERLARVKKGENLEDIIFGKGGQQPGPEKGKGVGPQARLAGGSGTSK